MIPQINASAKPSEIVSLLVAQVEELIKGKTSFETAISAVVYHRYGGRFARYAGMVRRVAHEHEKKHAVPSSPTQTAFLFVQHASREMERLEQ